MWLPVNNMRNLDKALRDAEEAYAKTKKHKTKKKISDADMQKLHSDTRKHVMRVICWCVLFALIMALLLIFIINSLDAEKRKAINDITDPRLLLYEEQIYTVKKLGLLFQITDDATYQNAKAAIKMSDDLKSRYFINQHYTGAEQESISLTYKSIQYELTENDSVNYLLSFTTKQGSKEKDYTVQAEYYNNELVYLNVL